MALRALLRPLRRARPTASHLHTFHTLRQVPRHHSSATTFPAFFTRSALSTSSSLATSSLPSLVPQPHRRSLSTSASTSTSTSAGSSAPGGLLGFPELRTAAGFSVLAARSKDRCEELTRRITAGETEGLATLRALDEISDAVCGVCDMAEFVRNVHADAAFREAADATFADLSTFIQELNTNTALHGSLVALTEGPLMAGLTPEQQRMAVLLKHEFERDGIHLPADDVRYKYAEGGGCGVEGVWDVGLARRWGMCLVCVRALTESTDTEWGSVEEGPSIERGVIWSNQ